MNKCFNLQKKISILAPTVAASECIHASTQSALMSGIWRVLSILRDSPTVRWWLDGVKARRFTKQDENVWQHKARRKMSLKKNPHRSTRHILCCGFLIILGLQIKELGLSFFKCCKDRQKKELTVHFPDRKQMRKL